MAETKPVAPEAIRAQIGRITQSAEFEDSARLKELVSYVVDEALAGRAGRIEGLTVTQAAFGADESFDADSNSIVRVAAGRLRRRLAVDYAGSGQHDAILVQVPKDTYAPRFLINPAAAGQAVPQSVQAAPPARSASLRQLPILAASLLLVVVASYLLGGRGSGMATPNDVATAVTGKDRTASEILFAQAFELLTLPEDGARLDTLLSLFRRVSEIAPNFAGGYAGQSLAHSIGVLFFKSADPERDLAAAMALADRAVDLDPEYTLFYAALAVAHSMRGAVRAGPCECEARRGDLAPGPDGARHGRAGRRDE